MSGIGGRPDALSPPVPLSRGGGRMTFLHDVTYNVKHFVETGRGDTAGNRRDTPWN